MILLSRTENMSQEIRKTHSRGRDMKASRELAWSLVLAQEITNFMYLIFVTVKAGN